MQEVWDIFLRRIYKVFKGYDGSDYNIMRLRKLGAQVGKGCRLFTSYRSIGDPWLIDIGDNTTISTNVRFITHDNAVCKIDYSEYLNCDSERGVYKDVFGFVRIGSNCFIGASSIIMYGVTVGNNCVVGAGAVVTKSIPDGQVWGGNPARYISDIESYAKKTANKVFEYSNRERARFYLADHPEKLVVK